jgi:hypothetical protein
VKTLIAFLILASAASGQTPGKIITFNQADAEHCKVVIVRGKPLLQSTYEGTTVSIAMPVNRRNGDFSIFVSVSRTGSGTIEVNPKDFYGLFSDKDHTRFPFYDQATALTLSRATATNPALSAANPKYDPSIVTRGSVGSGSSALSSEPGSEGPPSTEGPDATGLYLPEGKIKSGSGIAGWITLRQPKGGKLEVHPADMLDEVDIPVNRILFRF